MENWRKFELECVDYLNKTYGNYFSHLGFSDSTTSDIEYKSDEKSFFIEAKMPSAQSGQFVLLPESDKKEFVFSPRNKSKIDENVEFIIDHMNKNFSKYENAGTRGEEIYLSQDLFSNWIISNYKNQGVEFFITKGKDFIIFPIEQYSQYFKINCNFRVKKSGSSNVPKSRQNDVLNQLSNMDIEFVLLDDFMIKSTQSIDNIRFSIADSDYMIRKYDDDTYRIRKLSNTNNPNVIFSIKLIKDQDKFDLEKFKSRL